LYARYGARYEDPTYREDGRRDEAGDEANCVSLRGTVYRVRR
jgi:hypothetical protein